MEEVAEGWARLEPRGSLEPLPASVIDAALPPSLAALYTTHGVGWLFGYFAVEEPGSPAWECWQERARLLRSRGYFAGLPESTFAKLVVFACDRFGNALSVAQVEEHTEWFYLLACGGSALFVGDSVDALLDTLPVRLLLLFPVCDKRWNSERREYDYKHEWGLEATFVSRELVAGTVREAYLRAWIEGREKDADELLPQVLEAEPVALAAHALLADLCGPRGDALSDEARADAVRPLIAMVKRRFGMLRTVPNELFSPAPWTSPSVRAWAESENLLGMRRGPFAYDRAAIESLPIVEPIPDDARPPYGTPRFDDAKALQLWLKSWAKLRPAPALSRVRERVEAMSPSLRFAVVQHLAFDRRDLDLLPDAETRRFADDLRGVVGNMLDIDNPYLQQAWPLVLVLLVHATNKRRDETASMALEVVAAVDDPELTQALVALVDQGFIWPVRRHAGQVVCAFASLGNKSESKVYSFEYNRGCLINEGFIDDDTLERWLPLLSSKDVPEHIVMLVMDCIDDDRVYELALTSLERWPEIVAPCLVRRPGPRTEQALRAHLTIPDLEKRATIARALADLGDEEAEKIYDECWRRIDAMT